MSSGFALVLYTLHQIFVPSCGIVDNKVSLYVVKKFNVSNFEHNKHYNFGTKSAPKNRLKKSAITAG